MLSRDHDRDCACLACCRKASEEAIRFLIENAKEPAMGHPVRLEQLHIDTADKVARRRRAWAVEHALEPANGAPIDNDEALALDILGARCEAAGKLFYNPIRWHAVRDEVTNPDLGSFIDVKGIREHGHRLIVKGHGHPEWAYVLVSAEEHPWYHILCWCWGSDAMQQRFWQDPTGRDRDPATTTGGP
jgi:hypothetical protein